MRPARRPGETGREGTGGGTTELEPCPLGLPGGCCAHLCCSPQGCSGAAGVPGGAGERTGPGKGAGDPASPPEPPLQGQRGERGARGDKGRRGQPGRMVSRGHSPPRDPPPWLCCWLRGPNFPGRAREQRRSRQPRQPGTTGGDGDALQIPFFSLFFWPYPMGTPLMGTPPLGTPSMGTPPVGLVAPVPSLNAFFLLIFLLSCSSRAPRALRASPLPR